MFGTWSLAFALFASGCASTNTIAPASSTRGPITQIHIMTMPVGLNLDGRPGIDGFALKLFANDAENPKPVPIHSGTVEVLMFDGTLAGKTNAPPTLRTWKFSADELKPYEIKSRIGTGYELTLAWETNRPTQRLITLGARYRSSEGRFIVSQPSSVTVMDK